MKIVTACWVEYSLAEFEYNNALIYWSEHLNKCLYKHEIYVLVMEGYEKFPNHYINKIQNLGVKLIDVSHLLQKYAKKYEQLTKLTNKYEALCFLRWLLFDDFFASDSYIHIDMDIYPNQKIDIFDVLEEYLGVMYGCPAVSVISDKKWSLCYRDLLEKYLVDPDGVANYVSFRGTPYRNRIMSDQDLIAAAQASNILPWRFDWEKILESFYFSMNPLYVNNTVGESCTYRNINGDDYFSGKRVMFWHLQRDFVNYVGICYLLHNFKMNGNLSNVKIGQIDLRIEKNWATLLVKNLMSECQDLIRNCRTFLELELLFSGPYGSIVRAFSRDFIAKKFIGENEFRWIFSDEHWYKNGDFHRHEVVSDLARRD